MFGNLHNRLHYLSTITDRLSHSVARRCVSLLSFFLALSIHLAKYTHICYIISKVKCPILMKKRATVPRKAPSYTILCMGCVRCAYVHPILFYKYMNAGKKQINKQIGRIYQNTCTHTHSLCDIHIEIITARFPKTLLPVCICIPVCCVVSAYA